MAYIIPVASILRMSMDFGDLAPAVKQDIMNSFAAPRRFSYDQNNGLVVAIPLADRFIRIPRATPAELKAQVSTDIRLTRAGNCSSSQPEPASEQPYTWWLAQLIHYGLHLQLSKNEARREIELAMRAGVLTVPEHLHDLEKHERKAMKYRIKKEPISAINTQLSQTSSKNFTSRKILLELSSTPLHNDDVEREDLVSRLRLREPAQPEVQMQDTVRSGGGRSDSDRESSNYLDATFAVDAVNPKSKPKPTAGAETAEESSSEDSSDDERDSDVFNSTDLSFAQSSHSTSGKGSTIEQEDLLTTSDSRSEEGNNIDRQQQFSKSFKPCSFAEIMAKYCNKSALHDTIAARKVDPVRPTSSSRELCGVRESLRERAIAHKNIGNTSATVVNPPAGSGYDSSVLEIPEKLRGDVIRLKTVVPHVSTRSCLGALKSNKGDFAAACKTLIAETDRVQKIQFTTSNTSQTRKILGSGSRTPQQYKMAPSTVDTKSLPDKDSSSPRFQEQLIFTDTRPLNSQDEAMKVPDRFASLPLRDRCDQFPPAKGDLEANIKQPAPKKGRAQILWDDMLLEDVEDENVRSSVEFMQTVLPSRGVKECYESLEVTNHDFERALDFLGQSKPRTLVKITYSSDDYFAIASKTSPSSKKPNTFEDMRDVSWADSKDLVSKQQKSPKQQMLNKITKHAAQSASCGIQSNSKLVISDHMQNIDFAHASPGFERRRKRKSKVKPGRMTANARFNSISVKGSDQALAAQSLLTLDTAKDYAISKPECTLWVNVTP